MFSNRVCWMLCLIFLGCPAIAPADDIFAANQRLGRGVNLGNYLEAPRGASWGVSIEPKHLRIIREIGFDTIRLPVRWPDYAAKSAPYRIEPTFFQKIDGLMDSAEEVGLNVVLNIHHFEGLTSAPDEHIEQFARLWEQIGSRYQSRGEFLYFELNNEPHGELTERWNDILKIGLRAVRKSNPKRPVIVGPTNWNAIKALDELVLPEDPNLIVTVHMYNPHEFTHQGAAWVSERVQNIRNLPWGSAEERKSLREEIARAAAWGKKHNRPIYLGEFGAYQAAPMPSRIAWTQAVVEAAEANSMSWSYWEFGAGFGLYDIPASEWRMELLEALGVALPIPR